jgi:hypothetical protein
MALVAVGCVIHDVKPPIVVLVPAKAEAAPAPVKKAPEPPPPNPIVVDSDMTQTEALSGHAGPARVAGEEQLVTVQYYSFDQKLHQGQIVVDKGVAGDVKQIFEEIKESHFPISKVIPISRYRWSDPLSVAEDNTSGFNYRETPATGRLSTHSYGRAIDLNPWLNPYFDPVNGTRQTYDPSKPGTLTRNSVVVKIFRKHGWSWGGLWRHSKDYQHFEKR